MSKNGLRNSIHDTILDSHGTSSDQGMNDVDSELTVLISKLHNELKKYGDSVTLQELQTLISRMRDLKNLMLVKSDIPLVV